MSMLSPTGQHRWEELHSAALLFGLSPEEQVEHDALAATIPQEQREAFDRVVAALEVAWTDADTIPLPEKLREKILSAVSSSPSTRSETGPQLRKRELLAWMVAAAATAAALLLAFAPGIKPQPTVAEQRADLIAAATDLVRVDWSPGPTPVSGATGDVVWSSKRQQGYLRFRGLSINAPNEEQYQLWIFDKNQSDKTPVDGGVFDIPTDGEVIIPIQPKLQVQEVFLFAVTIEKPGGVVVSSRERLPLLAKVE